MSEGIIIVDLHGTISYINTAGSVILELDPEIITGRKFTDCFLNDPENDSFVQSFLDVIYEHDSPNESYITYHGKNGVKKLRIMASYLKQDNETNGIVVLLEDLSSLIELKDSIVAMEKIQELNNRLNNRNELLTETFGRYLSDEIVEKLISKPNGLNLGGRKRNVTILMSDLRGFTALSEHIEAKSLVSVLNHYLGEMIDVIEDFGGTVIEILGDGILVVFGALDNRSDHADNAVAAAISMQNRIPAINSWNEKHGYPNLKMGIGINTGEVIVGNIGSRKRVRFNVIGNEVNICGRIESYTVDGQVLVSKNTVKSVKAPLSIERELRVTPKGIEKEISLYQIKSIGEPYNIVVRNEDTKTELLKEPAPVCFYKLEEKHEIKQPCFGGLLSVAPNGAVLSTDTKLLIYDNICVMAGGKLLCKVMEKSGNEYLIRYNSIPSQYDAWLNRYKTSKDSN
jgi:adenylate cyclase